MMKSFSIVTLKAKNTFGTNPMFWDVKFRTFHEAPGMRMGESDIMPLYFKKSTNPEYDYIVCGTIDLDMFKFVSDCVINKGKLLTVLLYDSYPPTEYFENLAYFTHTNRSCEDLLITPKSVMMNGNQKSWHIQMRIQRLFLTPFLRRLIRITAAFFKVLQEREKVTRSRR